jgi:hypothetical protein
LVVSELDVFNGYMQAGAYVDVGAISGVSISTLTTGVTIGSTTYSLAVDNACFATIQSIMDAANAILGAETVADNTVGGSAIRTYENLLQIILNAINNNGVLAVAVYP